MTVNVTSPVTGGSQTGFTSPTYTVTADASPDVNAKQWAVTALGGTQAGVTAHSAAVPFTVAFWRPKILKILQAVTGQLTLVGKRETNTYSFVVRKGVIPLAGQPAQMMVITCSIAVPAGADTADPANVRAALSMAVGVLNQQSAGLGDTATSGIA
jgi:hypothetical protein